tara:strand:- start:12 stop:320 length:309 start_codon:yes stop_codon:yes gene_type:complete
MKKIIFTALIIFLVFATTFTKNSTKKLDKEIFETKENLRLLKGKYELVLLDYNYLTSPKKLMDYQRKYFENELIPIDIEKTNTIILKDNSISFKKFKNKFNE